MNFAFVGFAFLWKTKSYRTPINNLASQLYKKIFKNLMIHQLIPPEATLNLFP